MFFRTPSFLFELFDSHNSTTTIIFLFRFFCGFEFSRLFGRRRRLFFLNRAQSGIYKPQSQFAVLSNFSKLRLSFEIWKISWRICIQCIIWKWFNLHWFKFRSFLHKPFSRNWLSWAPTIPVSVNAALFWFENGTWGRNNHARRPFRHRRPWGFLSLSLSLTTF